MRETDMNNPKRGGTKMTIKDALEISEYDDIRQIIDVEDYNTSEDTREYFKLVSKALEKQIPYKLTEQDEDTGVCKCGRVTEIIDGESHCKYCGQKVIK